MIVRDSGLLVSCRARRAALVFAVLTPAILIGGPQPESRPAAVRPVGGTGLEAVNGRIGHGGSPTADSVSPQFDESRAVSGLIAPSGGTLSATAANGTVFTLTVPAGALLSDEEITMTPAASVNRLPLSGGLVAAVQMAPEGLSFLHPVTLVINPPEAVPPNEETTFAWRGSGAEFFLYPPEPVGSAAISLDLFHLSGYGVGRGSPADVAAQLTHTPSDPSDQLEQVLQGPAAEQRNALRTGGSLVGSEAKTASQAQATKSLTDFFLHVLSPAQPLVCADDWKGFLGKLTRFKQRVLTLTGPDATLLNAAQAYFESLFTLVANCYDKSYDLCKTNKDPFQGEDMAQIAGFLSGAGQASRVDFGKIEKCLTFELTLDSFVEEPPLPNLAGATLILRHQASAVVPNIVAISNGLGSTEDSAASDELTYVPSWIWKPGDSKCTFAASGTNSVITVYKLFIDINLCEGRPRLPLTMDYQPGHPTFTFMLGCPGAPQNITSTRWSDLYLLFHFTEFINFDYLARDWTEPGGGNPYAQKKYSQSNVAGTETTSLTLKHTPQ